MKGLLNKTDLKSSKCILQIFNIYENMKSNDNYSPVWNQNTDGNKCNFELKLKIYWVFGVNMFPITFLYFGNNCIFCDLKIELGIHQTLLNLLLSQHIKQ